jgi:predicted signal transduction protein with EAL and GGDEF domain
VSRVTVSLGVATAVPERRSSSALLLAAADQALYEAKRQGRNRVKVFQGLLVQASAGALRYEEAERGSAG